MLFRSLTDSDGLHVQLIELCQCRHAEECHKEQHKERSKLSTHSVDSLVINIVVIPRGLLRPYEFCVANVCQLTASPYAHVLYLLEDLSLFNLWCVLDVSSPLFLSMSFSANG